MNEPWGSYGDTKALVSASDLSIVHAEPRVLLVTIMNHFTQTLCVVVHGPLNTSTDEKPENVGRVLLALCVSISLTCR